MTGWEIFLTVLSVISTICAIVFGYSAFHSRHKKDNTDAGRDRGVMMSDIGYIKAGVDDLKREHRETTTIIGVHAERLTRVEESAKQAHRRIDEIKKGDGS